MLLSAIRACVGHERQRDNFAIFLRPTEQICPDSAGPFHSFDPVGFAIFAIPQAASPTSAQRSARHFRRSQPPMPAAFYNAALVDLPSLLIILGLCRNRATFPLRSFVPNKSPIDPALSNSSL